MAHIVRAASIGDHPWTSRFAPGGLQWWIVRSSLGADSLHAGGLDRDVARTLSPLLPSGTSADVWVARVEGSADAVRYALSTLPGEGRHLIPRRRPRWAVVAGLDRQGALALLDAAETVAIGVALYRVHADQSESATAALADVAAGATRIHAEAVVLRAPGAPWCVLGTIENVAERPADSVAVVDGNEPLPSPAAQSRRDVDRKLLAFGAVLALLLIAGGVAAWRLAQRGAPPRTSQLTALQPCSAGPLLETSRPPSPAGESELTAATDEAAGLSQVLLFDGNKARTLLWSGQRWGAAREAASPPVGSGATAAYDPVMHEVLMFGGGTIRHGAFVGFNATWAWNGCEWSRIAIGAPSPRAGIAVMAWDEAQDHMVLLTGDPKNAQGSQTWVWNGSRWSLRADASTSPIGDEFVMAFDPEYHAIVAVRENGADDDPSAPSTTWWWDGTRWHELAPPHPPAVGSPSAMVLDPLTNTLLLVGPSRQPFGSANQTWRWTGSDWVALYPRSAPDVAIAAVTNPNDGSAEVFGWSGPPSSSPVLGVWAWSGATWVRLADGVDGTKITGLTPPTRQFAATAYDSPHHELVLFGGNGTGSTVPPIASALLLDTWTFDGTRWTHMPTARHPPEAGPMVFDPLSGTILMVANANPAVAPGLAPAQRTWSWNGSAWRPLRPAKEIPGSTRVVAMVADPTNHTVVAVAESASSSTFQTWTWNGKTWSLRQPPNGLLDLPAGLQFAMAYDPVSQRVLLVGNDGSVGPASTWAWDGREWIAPQPKAGPLFDPVTATIATDPASRAVMLVAKIDAVPHTEIWNGSFWMDDAGVDPAGADTGYDAAAMYYDEALQQVVMLSSMADDFSEEWMWTGRAWLQLSSA